MLWKVSWWKVMFRIWEQFIGRTATEAEKHKVEKGQGSHQVFWKFFFFFNVEGGTKMLHHVDQGQVCSMGQALTGGPSRPRRGEGGSLSLGGSCVGVRGRSGHWSGWLPREGAFGPVW